MTTKTELEAKLKEAEALVNSVRQELDRCDCEEKHETCTVDNLLPGRTVYYVHALGRHSFTWEFVITGKPYVETTLSYFVKAKQVQGDYETKFSLMDCNVITNSYNQHKLFFNKRKAEHYLELCKARGV